MRRSNNPDRCFTPQGNRPTPRTGRQARPDTREIRHLPLSPRSRQRSASPRTLLAIHTQVPVWANLPVSVVVVLRSLSVLSTQCASSNSGSTFDDDAARLCVPRSRRRGIVALREIWNPVRNNVHKLTIQGEIRRPVRLFRAALIAASVLFLMTTATSVASAESSSALTPQYPWPHNGCTRVSDSPSGVSFTYACNHHDGCYARHWADRGTCDAWFRNDMLSACDRAPWYLQQDCSRWAFIYYGGVRALGQKYYDSRGELSRINVNPVA